MERERERERENSGAYPKLAVACDLPPHEPLKPRATNTTAAE
jgi:hypothetical protein